MKRLFGFLAVAGLVTFAAPGAPVQAASLIGPGAAAQTTGLTNDLAIEVRHGGGGGGFRGGGGGGFRGFHGGGGFRGFHGGGARFVGGPRFVGGQRFVAGPRFVGGPRFAYRHRFVHRRHFWRPYPVYYPYYYSGPRLYCRRVWTDFGPRRICRYRPWWI